jgi:SAM-dependent MidA family methyltransferase
VSLEEAIAGEIHGEGPISFGRFMHLALYHPEGGYYASAPDRVGWEGHFLTSPVLDPAFGELWAEGFRRVWVACGRPSYFEIIEVGPGDGSFAASVLLSIPDDFGSVLTYRLVERNPPSRRRQQLLLEGETRTAWSSSLDDVPPPGAGCVFANEVLDNLPVELARAAGAGVEQAFVDATGGEFQLVWRTAAAEVTGFFERGLPPETIAEVGLEAVRFAARSARTLDRGAVVFVDYGDEEAGLLRRPGGTLLCYSQSGIDDRPLERPGHKDITAHANWTAIRRALSSEGMGVAGPIGQRAALIELGLEVIDDRLREEMGSGGGIGAIRAISRRGALAILADPSGMGGFGVMVGGREIDPHTILPNK